MAKILLITDAWMPQINGVVTTLTNIVNKEDEYIFKDISPEIKKIDNRAETFINNVSVINIINFLNSFY